MDIKHILVHVYEDRGAATRYGLAANLAKEHGATLTGLVAKRPRPSRITPAYRSPQLSPEIQARISEAQMEMAAPNEDNAIEQFTAVSRLAGIEANTVTESEGNGSTDPAQVLGRHGRAADLVILGKPDTADPDAPPRTLPRDVLFHSGAPIVVVPNSANKTAGQRVVVAWNGSREASRAIRHAMPVLEHASQVSVLSVNTKGSRSDEPPGQNVAEHLEKHGVSVEVDTVAQNGISIDDVILARLADRGGDLLIMGAYGHSRLRRVIGGGVTGRMLKHATVPILMSH